MGKKKDKTRNGQGKVRRHGTYRVPASVVGLTETELYVLRLLTEGGAPPPATYGRALGRLGAKGFIEAAGPELEDGWKLTDAGVLALRRPGTFLRERAPSVSAIEEAVRDGFRPDPALLTGIALGVLIGLLLLLAGLGFAGILP